MRFCKAQCESIRTVQVKVYAVRDFRVSHPSFLSDSRLRRCIRLGIVEVGETVSDPFEVFSPKLFSGMKEDSQLTRHLVAQGNKVKLRTETSVRNR